MHLRSAVSYFEKKGVEEITTARKFPFRKRSMPYRKIAEQTKAFPAASTVYYREICDGDVKDDKAWKMNFSHHFLVPRYQEQISCVHLPIYKIVGVLP